VIGLFRRLFKALVELFRSITGKEMTATYRPTEDWDIPPEEMLSLLPPEAFDPPVSKQQTEFIQINCSEG